MPREIRVAKARDGGLYLAIGYCTINSRILPRSRILGLRDASGMPDKIGARSITAPFSADRHTRMQLCDCFPTCARPRYRFRCFAHADNWPQWMGPHRDNVWREDGLVEKFPEGGPRVVWRVPVAGGYAGPAVAEVECLRLRLHDRADVKVDNFDRKEFTGIERVLCLDEATGKRVASRLPGEVHDVVPGRSALHADHRWRQTLHARRRRQSHLLPGRVGRCRVAERFAEGIPHENRNVGLRQPSAHRRQQTHLPGRRRWHACRGAR